MLEAASQAELPLSDPGSDLSLDKDVGEHGARLSGGQAQRVAIARAMIKRGTIFLLDEPTTGLDGVVSHEVQKTLESLSTKATTILVTHHLGDLKKADKILYLKEGKIIESGTFDELIAKGGDFATQAKARGGQAKKDD